MEESLLFHSVRYWSSHWSWKHLEVPIPHLQAWWMAIHCRLRLCSFRCWIPNADPRAHSRSKDAERKCWSTKRNPPKTRRSWMGSIYCWIHHLYHLQHLARYGPCLHGSRRKAAMERLRETSCLLDCCYDECSRSRNLPVHERYKTFWRRQL